ncbi:biotin transporter BioY [cyanobiont of Ornithocercus magnificus]|nr:biotin transporter BioY [cyanobiont of Ornithocercus magnificus]
MLILVGNLVPAALLLPSVTTPLRLLTLSSTWQVPALLLCAIVCGPRAGVIAATAYMTIGLVDLPIFHNGGGLEYTFTPGFGFLAGFIPAAWLCGRLSQQRGMNGLARLTLIAIAGLSVLQFSGTSSLLLGASLGFWSEPLPVLLYRYGLGPLPSQLALCTAVGLLSLVIRRLLFIK